MLDAAAADLTSWRQFEYSLLELLRRVSDSQLKTKIRKQLSVARTRIAQLDHLLRTDRVFDTSVLPAFCVNPTQGAYYWCGFTLYPNSLAYCGFACPRCGAGVYRSKQLKPLGQGKKQRFIRVAVFVSSSSKRRNPANWNQ